MKILAVDTATRTCSVAVCIDDFLVSEINLFRRQTHSKHLLEMIHQAVSMSGEKLDGLDGFAVVRGPGSFTGLRIGLSCVKGLAYALCKPVVGVSSLEVLAFQAAGGHHDPALPICPLLDARKKEVYYSFFEIRDGKPVQKGGDMVDRPKNLPERIAGRCLFTGDGAMLYRDLLKDLFGDSALFAPPTLNYIRAHTAAVVALPRFSKFQNDQLASLVPQYVRKSDAELNFG